ncbi:MAG: pyruvate formate lyase family protein [Desulfatibacillaceae bacterium]
MYAGLTNAYAQTMLHLMAASINFRKSVREYLYGVDGWINFSIGFRTEDDSVRCGLRVREGRAKVVRNVPEDADSLLIFADEQAIREMLGTTPDEVLNMLLKSRLRIQGNLPVIQLFNFLVSLLAGRMHQKMMEKKRAEAEKEKERECKAPSRPAPKREIGRLRGERVEPGVKWLDDPYLSEWSLDDFPRLKGFLDDHLSERPAICAERPLLLTRWFRENGFEQKTDGTPWVPELRQGAAFRHLMANRKPIIHKNDLIAGTTTAKDVGVVLYPDGHGTMIWGELFSTPNRELNPYDVDEQTRRALHHEVFPYWIHRNFRESVREEHGEPLCQRLDERFAVYFLWKTVALSHTIPDFPRIMGMGTSGIIKEIRAELKTDAGADQEKKDTLEAMILCLEGLEKYAENLAKQAELEAAAETDKTRRAELKKIAKHCRRVPGQPARTLEEAVQAMWIVWVGLHMENTNAGLSLGRLDQWLQPYFAADIAKYKSKRGREDYIKRAVEIVGCFYMRCTDHLPLVPDIGNYLFGGSSSDQAITLGGTTPGGKDAVCDMTYIFLKVTEILGIRDPNVNARYNPEKNSDAYLRRLCEVNRITTATPSLHNDKAVGISLEEFRYKKSDAHDWSATGCVEPTLSGKHMGHTNCMMMNMVAALEMALNNGAHPLMRWDVGPKTGDPGKGAHGNFEDFYHAFTQQFRFLIDQSVEYNNLLGYAHQKIRPTPLLSSLVDDSIKKGRDVTKGGARYNSSGAACIGLADVTDSLMAIRKLVYDEKKLTFPELLAAVRDNFEGHPKVHALVTKKVPLFGSGDTEALELANRIAQFAHDTYGAHTNYRGGPYTAGFWSMSNHVAFGTLAGALPSGRQRRKAFTPGLTPEPHASPNLLDNLRDVASLDPRNMNNNIAFNVKVVPGAADTHEKVVDNIYSYAKTYFDLGGMQMQLNVVSSDTLRDAMANPDNYKNLLVRISGYNAYFVTLNRDMQMELIERAEYGI